LAEITSGRYQIRYQLYDHAAVRPREGALVTSQGHTIGVLQKALDRGNLVAAELAARELGRIPLDMALELTALIALHDPKRGRRASAKWLRLWLEKVDAATIDTVAVVTAYLSALGGQQHEWALAALRDLSPADRRLENADVEDRGQAGKPAPAC
jgi:hypothetical protein